MNSRFADPLDMQHTLFAELSRMFGNEVPLYDKSLAVNFRCNRILSDLLAETFEGFSVSDSQLKATSRERHGAIRIGREDEFRWITRFFACFGMEPHNFYDMTSIGAKSQPVIATAFRSASNPENRVFSSLLRIDYFDRQTGDRIRALLKDRQVFSDEARRLVELCEKQGGLEPADAEALINEGTGRIFKWTGIARGRDLYDDLCKAGFKIAADIACFSSHHLNHLTPNTLCIDLYSVAMKWRMGLIEREHFLDRANRILKYLDGMIDTDWLMLHFRHVSHDDVDRMVRKNISDQFRRDIVARLAEILDTEELSLSKLPHNGYKDATEGPDTRTQVLLRQDAYRALTEPIRFVDEQPPFETVHTARFGEIEQRFYATTPRARKLYDACLSAPDPIDETENSNRVDGLHTGRFDAFPETLSELYEEELAFVEYEPSTVALETNEQIMSINVAQLIEDGILRRRGMRYEDFLPVSAAGIFASNLDQYGTDSTAESRPTYTQEQLEEIIGRSIIDSNRAYLARQWESLLSSLHRLGLGHLQDHPAGRGDHSDANRRSMDSDPAKGSPADPWKPRVGA